VLGFRSFFWAPSLTLPSFSTSCARLGPGGCVGWVPPEGFPWVLFWVAANQQKPLFFVQHPFFWKEENSPLSPFGSGLAAALLYVSYLMNAPCNFFIFFYTLTCPFSLSPTLPFVSWLGRGAPLFLQLPEAIMLPIYRPPPALNRTLQKFFLFFLCLPSLVTILSPFPAQISCTSGGSPVPIFPFT